MNLRRQNRLPSDTRGAALLAALCFTIVLAISLSSYITACYRSLQMSNRNVSSGHSAELAELGMEECLWALNKNNWTGWGISGTTATKSLASFTYDNGSTGSASLTIANYTGTSGTRTITVVGTVTQTSDSTTQSRTVTATASPAGLFVNAVAGTGNSTTSYNGRVRFRNAGTVDSYDSSTDVNAATAGYSAVLSSASDLTSLQTATGTVQLTNVQIKGYTATMPGSAGVNSGTSATLYGPTSPASPKIDTNRESTSPYQPVFDVVTPSAPTPLASGTQTIVAAPGGATTYCYYAGDYYLGTGETLTVNGPTVIVISGYLWTTSTGKIVVGAAGSLQIYLAGDMALDGGGIVNNTNLPKNVAIFGQPGNTYNLEIGTTQAFRGVMYAPEASMTFNNNVTIFGAVVAQAVTFSSTSSPTFHYDTTLRATVFAGIDTPFAVANVRDTTNP